MRGREFFNKYNFLIRIIEYFFSFLPHYAKEVLWTITDSWRGKPGVLIRYIIAKTSAKSCGEVVYIGPYVEIRQWKNLQLGSYISIHRGCYIDASGGITIEDNVSIAHGTSILSFDHQWTDPSLPIRDNTVKFSSVHIMNDVWIGCSCQIMAGVTIKSRSVVAAGAVVVKDVDKNSIVGGVPARCLKTLLEV